VANSQPDLQQPERAVRVPTMIANGLTAAAMISAVVLRWFDLGKLSLWWDEGFTAWASTLSSANIVRFAQTDNQPPLYYLLIHYWQILFGNSEYALRALSALFGTLSLPIFYLLAKKVLKDSTAVALAVCLFAFSMKQIWYSREARAYEVASFFALVALYALVLFLEKRSLMTFVIIVMSAATTLYIHNMMAFYVLALNVTWLIYPSERGWAQRVKELLLADILAGFLYLPWALTLFTQVAAVKGNLSWVPRPTFWTVVGTLWDIAGFEMSYLFAVASKLVPFPMRMGWLFLVGGASLLCAALLAGGVWRVPKADRNRDLALLLYCLLPIVAVFVLSQKILPLYIDRVFTASSVVVPIVFAYPLALQRGQKGRALYGFLGIVLAATTALSAFGFLRYREGKGKNNEDWRGATSSLVRIQETNRLIVFVPPAGEMLFDYYRRKFPADGLEVSIISLPVSFYDQFPPPKSKPIGASEIDRLKLALESKNYSEVDLVLAHEVDPQGLTLDFLDRTFGQQEGEENYGTTVKIVRFLALSHESSDSRDVRHGVEIEVRR